MSEKQTWHVAVGDTAPFGALHVFRVQATNEVDAAYLAGIQAQLLGPDASSWVVRDIQSQADRDIELAHDAAEAKAQRMHDEMVDSMYADGLIS